MEKIRNMSLALWGERHKLLRFLFSGGISAGVNLFFLHIFTEYFGFYYLWSVVLAFIIAVCVSFIMQKFWTFRDKSKEDIHKQVSIYVTAAIINTIINTGLVYLLVEYMNVHYLLSQIISSGLIAFESFFVYKYFIFSENKTIQ